MTTHIKIKGPQSLRPYYSMSNHVRNVNGRRSDGISSGGGAQARERLQVAAALQGGELSCFPAFALNSSMPDSHSHPPLFNGCTRTHREKQPP